MLTQRIRQHKILAGLSVILTLLLMALISVIIFSEAILRYLVEEKGSEMLGRELAIEGSLDVDWHWTHTVIHAENITLANAPDYPERDMARVETFDLTIKPIKLLIGKLEFGNIIITRPHILLDRKAESDMNWNFPALSRDTPDNEAAVAQDRHDIPIVGQLIIKEGQLIYRDVVEELNLELDLDTVVGQGGDENDNQDREQGFTLAGTGSIQEQHFELEAAGASLETLRDTNKKFPLKLRIAMGPTEVLFDGELQDPIKLTGIDAALKITGNNMANIYYLTAIPLPPTPPYSLEGRLTKTNGVWGYKGFKGKVGSSDLSGSLSYDTGGERGFLQANLSSELLDSDDLGGFIGLTPTAENATPEQQQAAAEKEASPNLIPDVPLEVERLRTTDLDVILNAKKIDAPGLPFKGMEVRFFLRDGVLKLDPLHVTLADGTVDGTIKIDAKKDVPPMAMNLNLRRLSLGRFFENTRFAETTKGLFGGTVTLTGIGASLAEVLATSDGEVSIIMSEGKISLMLVEASDLDIAQALPLFLGDDQSTEIRCAVVDFTVDNGLLTSDVLVLDTGDALLIGDVKINMEKETIAAKLDAKPKDNSLLAVQTPITITGKLKQPSVGVDAKEAAARGLTAVALGALLTPFAALIPFIEAGEGKNADCRALIYSAKP